MITSQVQSIVSPSLVQLSLQKRMQGPQRHRLLQGYPMPPLMVGYDRRQPYQPVTIDRSRPLIVGVLPHASCNPSVKGCGYCTFPHEEFRKSQVEATVEAVIAEVDASESRGRQVDALYFGGGTANLTPPAAFTRLCRSLEKAFVFNDAEVTLEGAPVYFSSHREALLGILESELSCTRRRVSMGVQTFDRSIIEQMGRSHLGSPEAVERAVVTCQKRGISTSADLMINMPFQTLDAMKADIKRASDLGFSQVCIYHLVLFRGLGTPWAKDGEKLRSIPDNERAFENWMEARALALSLGYRQTTLTNFEREGDYRYENCSYQPAVYDGVGFGPEAISCFTDASHRAGVKWLNESASEDYREAIGEHGGAGSRVFVYGEPDLRILFLTRSLPRLGVSRALYQETFGTDLVADFSVQLEALREGGLVVWDSNALELTPRGMFYADSVAGLLAEERVGELRKGIRAVLNDPPVFRMG